MVFRTTSTERTRRRRAAGFTAVEMLVASGLGAMCFAIFATVLMFGARSFQALTNYSELHSKNRIAMDTLSSDIRGAKRVASYTSTVLTLEDFDGTTLEYAYNPSKRRFTREKNGVTRILLEECDRLSFQLGERNPIGGSYDVYPPASAATAKVIDVSWVCSRKILGIAANSESVQTARIVIRKQGT